MGFTSTSVETEDGQNSDKGLGSIETVKWSLVVYITGTDVREKMNAGFSVVRVLMMEA